MSTRRLRILHLEDDEADAYLVGRAVTKAIAGATIVAVSSRDAFLAALEREPWDVVISDNALPSFASRDALAAVRERRPSTPFIVLSGAGDEAQIAKTLAEGATAYVLKDRLGDLVAALQRLQSGAEPGSGEPPA